MCANWRTPSKWRSRSATTGVPWRRRTSLCPPRHTAQPAGPGVPLVSVPDGGLDFDRTLAVIERSILEQALRKTGGNKKAAADMLRLKRTTLSAKMRSLEAAAC